MRPESSWVPEESRRAHLELVLEMSAVGIWELDVDSGSAWRTPQHDRIFGYEAPLSEWSYARFLDHVLPEDRHMVDRLYGSALRDLRPWSFECRIRRADGETRWISASGRPVAGARPGAAKLIGHVLDITHVKRTEEHLRVLIDELNHRVRNTLSIVQAIAGRSFPDGAEPAQGRRDFRNRIDALATAHSLLTDRTGVDATIGDVVDKTLRPYERSPGAPGPARFEVAGPPEPRLTARQAVSLTMALNELATNAIKHGALGAEAGRVTLDWTETMAESGPRLEMRWRERGGPPVSRGERTGFGLTLIERLMPGDLDGAVDLDFAPEGLSCRIEFGLQPLTGETRLPD